MRNFSAPRRCIACEGDVRFRSWGDAVHHFHSTHRYLLQAGHLADEFLLTLPDEVVAEEEPAEWEPPSARSLFHVGERDTLVCTHCGELPTVSGIHSAKEHSRVIHDEHEPLYGIDYVHFQDRIKYLQWLDRERDREVARFAVKLASVRGVGDLLLDAGENAPDG